MATTTSPTPAGLAAVAVALLAATPLAAADIPGNASTRATLTLGAQDTIDTLDSSPDVDWYRVNLQKGQDYAVYFSAGEELGPVGATLTLRDAAGRQLARQNAATYADSGFEYRAPRTGAYLVEVAGRMPRVRPANATTSGSRSTAATPPARSASWSPAGRARVGPPTASTPTASP